MAAIEKAYDPSAFLARVIASSSTPSLHRKKLGIWFTSGCMTEARSAAVFVELAPLLKSVPRHYYGTSVGGIIALYAENDPEHALGIFSHLAENNFFNIPENPMRRMAAIAMRGFAQRAGRQGNNTMIRSKLVLDTLEAGKFRAPFKAVAASEVKRTINTTCVSNAETLYYSLNDADEKTVLRRIQASMHVPILMGNPPVLDENGLLIDGCYGELPFRRMIQDGCTDILVLSGKSQQQMESGEDDYLKLIRHFAHHVAPHTIPFYEQRSQQYIDCFRRIDETGVITTHHGSANVIILRPQGNERGISPTENNTPTIQREIGISRTHGQQIREATMRKVTQDPRYSPYFALAA
jgi:predicted patatin/cPLA2 family phospholipase